MVFGINVKSFVHALSEILVLTYQNTKNNAPFAHVAGGIHLEFNSAQPRNWFRAEAQTMCERIAQIAGGVTWDMGGVQHLVVPAHVAAKVVARLYMVFRNRISEYDLNAMASVAGVEMNSNLEWNFVAELDKKGPDLIQQHQWTFEWEDTLFEGKTVLMARRKGHHEKPDNVFRQQIPDEWVVFREMRFCERTQVEPKLPAPTW